uniref:Putative tubby C-terminal-like domain-containing protein n=1 Tax=Helianthus annuus TaxID=4232 RepID=A0A251UEX6_HELAN
MAKVHLCIPSSSSSCSMAKVHLCIPSSSSSCSTQRETYTIWMKSLVLNSNGYTVYDSNGEVVFRIDNYDSKCRSEVYLMDLRGNIVCTILRKVQRKLSSSGVALGEDVLFVTIEPHIDHIFVMSLVAILGLIRRKM